MTFSTVLQIVLSVIFAAGGFGALMLQNMIGPPMVLVGLGLFALLAVVVGYVTATSVMNLAHDSIAAGDPVNAQAMLQAATNEATRHWEITAINVGVLAAFALFALLRAYLRKRARLF